MKKEGKETHRGNSDKLNKKIPKMYFQFLNEINQTDLSGLSDLLLKEMSFKFRYRAMKRDNLYDLMVPAFSLARVVSM